MKCTKRTLSIGILKPLNIYIPEKGAPVLLDFGAARQAMLDKNQRFTVILSHGYAPIEQYYSMGKQGPYSDIYACAATMYSCLRGPVVTQEGHKVLAPPIAAPDRQSGSILPHIKKVSRQPLSDRVAEAIMQGLEFNAEKRPQTVVEFQKKLQVETPSRNHPEDRFHF